MSMTYREYWTEVDRIAAELSEGPDALEESYGMDEPYDVAIQIVDGHEYVIYYNKAFKVLEYTDNDDAYFEVHDGPPQVDSFTAMLTPLAYFAMLADVMSRVEYENPSPARRYGGGRRNPAAAMAVGAGMGYLAGRSKGPTLEERREWANKHPGDFHTLAHGEGYIHESNEKQLRRQLEHLEDTENPPSGFPFPGQYGRWRPGGDVIYEISQAPTGPGGSGGGVLLYFAPGANHGQVIAADDFHSWKLTGSAARHLRQTHPEIWGALPTYTKARLEIEAKSALRPARGNPAGRTVVGLGRYKWHRDSNMPGGVTGYWYSGGPGSKTAVAVPYKPRKSRDARQYAAYYEQDTGRKIPKGTKWLVALVGGFSVTNVSAHKTLKAAKAAGAKVVGAKPNKPKKKSTRSSNGFKVQVKTSARARPVKVALPKSAKAQKVGGKVIHRSVSYSKGKLRLLKTWTVSTMAGLGIGKFKTKAAAVKRAKG